jgi:hypothetical protein
VRWRGEAQVPAHAVLHLHLFSVNGWEQPRARSGAGAYRVRGKDDGEGGTVDGNKHRPGHAVPRHTYSCPSIKESRKVEGLWLTGSLWCQAQ